MHPSWHRHHWVRQEAQAPGALCAARRHCCRALQPDEGMRHTHLRTTPGIAAARPPPRCEGLHCWVFKTLPQRCTSSNGCGRRLATPATYRLQRTACSSSPANCPWTASSSSRSRCSQLYLEGQIRACGVPTCQHARKLRPEGQALLLECREASSRRFGIQQLGRLRGCRALKRGLPLCSLHSLQ